MGCIDFYFAQNKVLAFLSNLIALKKKQIN